MARTIVLAAAAWTALVLGLALEGAWENLPPELVTALALFASGYAVAVFTLDAEVRGTLERAPATVLAMVVAVGAGLAGAALMATSGSIARSALLLGAPVALVALAALARRMPRFSSRPAASPGARPAGL